MTYNKIFLKYLYPNFLNDNNNKFVLLDTKKINSLDYIYINELYHNKNNIYFYYHNVYNNLLFDKDNINRIEYIYLQIQKLKLYFSKFIHIIKLKIKNKFNNKNLLFEPFKKNYISLLENNIIYNFDIIELYKITNNSFNYQEFGTPKFIHIKNPYTNISFSLHNIINIFFILMNYGKIPKLFYLFFQENLNEKSLYINYNINIYINCLTSKYKNSTCRIKLRNIKLMLINEPDYECFLSFKDNSIIELFEKPGLYFYLYRHIKNNYNEQEDLLIKYKNIYNTYLDQIYKSIFNNKMYYNNDNYNINNNNNNINNNNNNINNNNIINIDNNNNNNIINIDNNNNNNLFYNFENIIFQLNI